VQKDNLPSLQLLNFESMQRIVESAYTLLQDPGFFLHSKKGLEILADAGAQVDSQRNQVKVNSDLVDKALSTAPGFFTLYDQQREQRIELQGDNIYFGTAGTAIFVQDFNEEKKRRRPVTKDFVEHNIVLENCEYLAVQGGPFVCADVPKEIADTYRLLLCMLFTRKPTLATNFSPEGYVYMKEMLEIMAENSDDIVQRPAHGFAANISSPLAWSEIAADNFINSAEDGIPVIFVSIPIAGGTAPVTLAGTLVQITAENLSAVVISQMTNPGTPILWGGSPSILEMRYGTTPMTSIESIIMSCANTQIGRHFGLPTEAHGGRSDSKRVDSQSGIEATNAITLTALVGSNLIGGAGFLEYASTQNLEKLLIDNDLCGQVFRLIRGFEVNDDTMGVELIKDLSQTTEGFMESPHTLKWFKREFHFPTDIMDVRTRSQYETMGSKNIRERAHDRVTKILSEAEPITIDHNKQRELIKVVKSHAKKYGMEKLPVEDWKS
jgi:trimethylamine--corrinoid protein Co-methyltransferase